MPEGFAKRLIQILVYLLFLAVTLFVSAGSSNWPAAWAFLGLATLVVVLTGAGLLTRNPDLITERTRVGADTPMWDRVITGLYGLFGFCALIVAGLDMRLSWSGLPVWIMILGGVMFFGGNLLPVRAMWENAYFATTVRIQEDRSHRVVTTGPYSWVRHPGYSGWALAQLAIPLLLGSVYTLIPAFMAVVMLVIRTGREDQFLKENLTGYVVYATAVKYRLIPGVW